MKKKDNVCCIKVGNVSFNFRWSSSHVIPSIYLPFIREGADTKATFYSIHNQSQNASKPEVIYWQGPSWRMSKKNNDILIDVCDPSSKQWSCAVKTNASFEKADLYSWVHSGVGVEEIIQPPVDRVLLVNRLSIKENVVLHASVIKTSVGLLLFCGRSGIGKSTVANIWTEAGKGSLLNDDRAVVFCEGNNVLAGAMPWHGKNPTVNPATGQLRAIFHLGQAPKTTIRRIPNSLAVAKLLATSTLPFYYEPSIRAVTDAVANICAVTPSYELDVFPDKSLPEMIMNKLEVDMGGKE